MTIQGSVNCHNRVTVFGERCKLCTVMNEGVSASALYSTFAPIDSSSSHSYRGSVSSQDSAYFYSDVPEESRGRTKERKSRESKKDKVRRSS